MSLFHYFSSAKSLIKIKMNVAIISLSFSLSLTTYLTFAHFVPVWNFISCSFLIEICTEILHLILKRCLVQIYRLLSHIFKWFVCFWQRMTTLWAKLKKSTFSNGFDFHNVSLFINFEIRLNIFEFGSKFDYYLSK